MCTTYIHEYVCPRRLHEVSLFRGLFLKKTRLFFGLKLNFPLSLCNIRKLKKREKEPIEKLNEKKQSGNLERDCVPDMLHKALLCDSLTCAIERG